MLKKHRNTCRQICNRLQSVYQVNQILSKKKRRFKWVNLNKKQNAIGGKENVTAVTHCATRMRFVLGDDKKADVKTIEAIPAVKGTFTNAGQFQVIIGNDVPIFYNDFTAVSGIEGVSKEAAKSAAKSN